MLCKSFAPFRAKPTKNTDKFIKILLLAAIIFDIYKSRNDFNIFSIIALYIHGLFSINFIYCIVEMLEICSLELESLNKRRDFSQKRYHHIHTAVKNVNKTFGISLLDYILYSASLGLFFCYKHCLNLVKLYKNEELATSATVAPDVWTVVCMVATFSLTRAAHKLKMRAATTTRHLQEKVVPSEILFWQLNYEKMELSAWEFFTIGNHIFISVS